MFMQYPWLLCLHLLLKVKYLITDTAWRVFWSNIDLAGLELSRKMQTLLRKQCTFEWEVHSWKKTWTTEKAVQYRESCAASRKPCNIEKEVQYRESGAISRKLCTINEAVHYQWEGHYRGRRALYRENCALSRKQLNIEEVMHHRVIWALYIQRSLCPSRRPCTYHMKNAVFKTGAIEEAVWHQAG